MSEERNEAIKDMVEALTTPAGGAAVPLAPAQLLAAFLFDTLGTTCNWPEGVCNYV